MKFIIKVSKHSLFNCYLIIILATMPIISSAQDVIDTSSPQDLLVEPTIVLTPSIDEPDCHTYTGCGVIVVNKYLHLKPKLHKLKRHRVHREPSCVIEESYVSFVPQCW